MNPKRIPHAQLANNPGRVLEAVRAGEPVILEETGHSPTAIVDLMDFQILLAAIHYFVHRPRLDLDAGLPDSLISDQVGQPRCDVAVAHYLSGAISLSRAAEALETSWLDLRKRFSRLGLPIRTGPADAAGAREDALIAESLAS